MAKSVQDILKLIEENGIKITCRECGSSRVIPTDSLLAANAFLNVDSITLE